MNNLPEFRNEPYTDFTLPENRTRMEAALAKVKAQFGRHYDLLVAGERIATKDQLQSVNPSKPAEIVGVHSKASPEIARQALEKVFGYFPVWSATSAQSRVDKLLRAAALLRERKLEFNAWLCYEAGKTWPEAEAEIAEAVDFCEYYAREMLRFAHPPAVVQLAGERDEMRYLPLGVGIVIPPWNFALAILAGMAVAALVTGNTVVIKPSSETPIMAAKFVELLLEAGFPARMLLLFARQRRGDWRSPGPAPQNPLHLLHRFPRRWPPHQRTRRQTPARPAVDQARGRRDGW